MCKVHWYIKCGNTIPIFELGSNSFHISVDTPIPDWDDYYNQSKQLEFNRYRVKAGKTIDWVSFSSLSSATSFLYGKPCDIKTTIRFSRELTDDESKLLSCYYLLNRASIYDIIYESGESFVDVLWKLSNNENSIKEDYINMQVEDLFSLSADKKIGAGEALVVSGKSEILAKALAKAFEPLLGVDDTIKIIRRYENSFNYYNKDNIGSLFSLSNSMKVLYEKLYNFLTLVSYRQPIYLLGEAGVGKNVLEEQIIKGIAEKYGAFVASFDFDTSTTQANTTMSTSPLTDNEIYGIYIEAIIKANEEYFASSTENERKAKLSSDLEALKNNTYEPSCNQVIVLGNEFSRQRGDTLAKLLSFLSNRGAEINIGGKIYYNTPNLLLFFNGNTVVEGRVVGGNILSDKAWGSRLYMYEMTGIFYLNPKTHKVMTDIYESLKDDETLSDEFKVKLDDIYNKLADIGLDTTYSSESKKNLPADCKINMREVFNALAVDSLAESCGF